MDTRKNTIHRAIKAKLIEKGYKVAEQLFCRIMVADTMIGKFYLDFLVSDGIEKIILEIKVANEVYPQHVKQVVNYLKANNIKLGLVGVFSKNGVIIKRVIS